MNRWQPAVATVALAVLFATTLSAQQPGFKRYSREAIRIQVESAVRVDATLQVGDVAEVMTVSDQAPLLQTQSGTIGKVIEGRTVQDTPLNGRNVLNLIALAPPTS